MFLQVSVILFTGAGCLFPGGVWSGGCLLQGGCLLPGEPNPIISAFSLFESPVKSLF